MGKIYRGKNWKKIVTFILFASCEFSVCFFQQVFLGKRTIRFGMIATVYDDTYMLMTSYQFQSVQSYSQMVLRGVLRLSQLLQEFLKGLIALKDLKVGQRLIQNMEISNFIFLYSKKCYLFVEGKWHLWPPSAFVQLCVLSKQLK